jgi:hypothetical protein
MEWIEQKLSEWRKMQGDLMAIEGAADSIFEQLWDDIAESARVADLHGMGIKTNGMPRHRTVIMAQPLMVPRMAADRRLTIDLVENRRRITTNSDAGNKDFTIEICPDGVVCLKLLSQRISIQDAAREVMEDFLFKGDSPFSSRV